MFFFNLFALTFSLNHRTIVLLGEETDESLYSQFFDDLRKYSSVVDFKTLTDDREDKIILERFGEKLYDTVVVMGQNTENLGKDAHDLIRFIDNGGNVMIFACEEGNQLQSILYKHLSITVEKNKVQDIYFNKDVVLRNIVAPKAIVSKQLNPLLYNGLFTTIQRPNDFRMPIAVGGQQHIGVPTFRAAKNKYGAQIVPIACFQGRTGGRITLVLSSDFHTDYTYEKQVTTGEDLTECEPVENGNRELMIELIQWVSHYKSYARVVSATHYDEKTKVAPVQYTYNQTIHVVAQIEEMKEGEAVPYSGECQVEIFMLGTFVRRHMKSTELGKYEGSFNIPDRAGNYWVKVFTDNGDGYHNAREEMAIAVRPLAIREKPHFLNIAKPYNSSSIVIMIGAFLAVVHFLYHRPSN